MLSVSNDFKTALTQPKTIDAKIIVGGSTITSDNLNQIKRSFNCGLFKTVAKMVEIDSNTTIAKDTTIEPKFGVYIDNAFEYVTLGTYKTRNDPNLKKDTNSYEITAYDKIVESMVDYGLTNSDITYPCTVRQMFVAIFTKLGWATTYIPATFTNSTSQIEEDVFSNVNMTYRDVLDELCTITCMFLIDDNGTPTLTTGTTTNETIDEEYLSDTSVEVKENVFFNSLVFSRASDSDNIYRQDSASITTNGLHEFKVSDLQILSLNWRSNFIDAMWNYIKTFTYYAYDINTVGITFLQPVDDFTISIFSSTYSTLLLNSDLTIGDGVNEKIYANAPKETETDYKYATDTDKKINQTTLIVDKQNQIIEALVSDTQIISNKLTYTNEIQLQNAYEGTLHYLSIKGQMSLLYPSNTLHPSNTLYPLDTYLLVDGVKQVRLDIDYLNYISYDVCDEFIYEDGKCKIIRRVGVDNNDNLYPLDEEIIEEREDAIINVKENSTIKLESFNNLTYSVEYLLKNDYTNSFAPTVDIVSKINLSPGEVKIEAAKLATITADKIDFRGKTFNLEAEDIEIIGENFKLDKTGKIEATNGKIGGWEMGDYILFCEIRPPYDYTSADTDRISGILTETITPTTEDYEKYDFDKDGEITSKDLLTCAKLVRFNIKNSNPAKLIFDTSDWFKPIKIINSSEQVVSSFGVTGSQTYND